MRRYLNIFLTYKLTINLELHKIRMPLVCNAWITYSPTLEELSNPIFHKKRTNFRL